MRYSAVCQGLAARFVKLRLQSGVDTSSFCGGPAAALMPINSPRALEPVVGPSSSEEPSPEQLSPIRGCAGAGPSASAAAGAGQSSVRILMSPEQRARRLEDHYDMLQARRVPRPAREHRGPDTSRAPPADAAGARAVQRGAVRPAQDKQAGRGHQGDQQGWHLVGGPRRAGGADHAPLRQDQLPVPGSSLRCLRDRLRSLCGAPLFGPFRTGACHAPRPALSRP